MAPGSIRQFQLLESAHSLASCSSLLARMSAARTMASRQASRNGPSQSNKAMLRSSQERRPCPSSPIWAIDRSSIQSKSKCQDRGDASWLWRPGRWPVDGGSSRVALRLIGADVPL